MNCEIICVGTEFLTGDLPNLRMNFVARQLTDIGVTVTEQIVLGDRAEDIGRQVACSVKRCNLLVIFGGMGATQDDLTKQAVADALQVRLVEDKYSLAKIHRFFQKDAREMSAGNRRQALVFEGGIVLENNIGLAPGCFIEKNNCMVVLLPGPRAELIRMLSESVLPIVKKKIHCTVYNSHVRVFGIDEAKIEEMCAEFENGQNPTVTTHAYRGEVDICISAKAENKAAAEKLCAPVAERLQKQIGENVYTTQYSSLEETVVQKLLQSKKRVATAESCTAGLLSKLITDVPGSSAVFEMGIVAYANYIKIEALGVSERLIRERGAVCPEVAVQMANGVRKMCGADIGVGITGVAGPAASENKPVGLVFIAVAGPENAVVLRVMRSGGGRDAVRSFAAAAALDMIRRYLDGCEKFISYATAPDQPLNVINEYSLPVVPFEHSENHSLTTFKTAVDNSTAADEVVLFNWANAGEEAETKPSQLPEQQEDYMNYIFDDGAADEPAAKQESAAAENAVAAPAPQKAPKRRGFWRSLFPVKGDSVGEKVRKSIFLVALVVLIVTLSYLVNYFAESWLAGRAVSNAASAWNNASMQKDENGVFIAFKELMKNNSDIKAWMKIEGTNINNPVYQTTNNDYYIDHDMNKQSSRYGALFIDKDAAITATGNSKNVVVYGHHMRDGTMFGTLKKYTDINFYKQHPVIDFTTLYLDADYKVFAVFITNTKPEQDNGEVFNYRYPEFASEEDFLSFVNNVKVRSIIDTGVEVDAQDELLTLSTCTYEFDDARLVVMARKVRVGEQNAADTSAAKVNPTPLYPQIWYTKHGTTKPNISLPSATSSNAQSSEQAQPDASSNTQSTQGAASSASQNRAASGAAGSRSAGSAGSSRAASSAAPSASSKNGTPAASSAPVPSSSAPAASSAPSPSSAQSPAVSQPANPTP